MWINTSLYYLRRLCSIYGLGEVCKKGHTFYKVIVGGFNAKVALKRTLEELHIGTNRLLWKEKGERLSEFIVATKTIHGNSQFQKPPSLRWMWESPGGDYHNGIDYIIVNRCFSLTDAAVVPKFCTGSDHRLLRGHLPLTRGRESKSRGPRTIINWDLFDSLAGLWKDSITDNIDEEYDRFIQRLHDCAKKAERLKVTKRRLSPLALIPQRGAARAAGNH